jgi:hypothetical protein
MDQTLIQPPAEGKVQGAEKLPLGWKALGAAAAAVNAVGSDVWKLLPQEGSDGAAPGPRNWLTNPPTFVASEPSPLAADEAQSPLEALLCAGGVRMAPGTPKLSEPYLAASAAASSSISRSLYDMAFCR